MAVLSARYELASELFVVEFLYYAVDPAETYGFLDRVIAWDAWFSSVRFVVDEPDFFPCCVVLLKPLAPLFPARYTQLFSRLHLVQRFPVYISESWASKANSWNSDCC